MPGCRLLAPAPAADIQALEGDNQASTMSRKADWAAFKRSLEPGSGKRTSRTSKVPPEVALLITNGQAKQTDYFDLWLASGKDWGTVMATERAISAKASSAGGNKCWMTKVELLERYKLSTIVDAIIARKEQDPALWRPHPDCPDCDDAKQYWVLEKETEAWLNESRKESTTECRAYSAINRSGASKHGGIGIH
eukprot:4518930-Lingulodinium_polyedra.AAC.1